MRITITESGIQFAHYPFQPASVYPDGLLAWADVREVVIQAFPPEVRTRQGEVLFVEKASEAELVDAALQRGLPCVRRVDVWSLLLDPFLDTEFDDAVKAGTARTLAECGIAPDEQEAIRARFSALMISYNFDTMLWEWVHLGLYDLLYACDLAAAGGLRCGPPGDMAAIYWDAMRLAECGKVID
ncbi:hypothetical protein F8S13_14615 [Chloroflexia bacterium SDU3-3]|nr:hypothetical protein F8S13_14615 [Chloroflexia bacterium SDU3-3]